MSTLLADFQVGEKVLTAEYRHVTPYARVLDSIEVYGKDRQSRNEEENGSKDWSVRYLPDVFRINPISPAGKPDFIAMTERVQHWMFRIMVERYRKARFTGNEYHTFWEGQLTAYKKDRQNGSTYITWFNQLFKGDRSHTNRAGVDTRRNYIAQENMDADYPKFAQLVTGRWVGKVNDVDNSNVYFDCINMSGDFEQYHPFTHPHLFDQPIVTGRDLKETKAGWEVTRYWWRVYYHFNQMVVFPVMLPKDAIAEYPRSGVEFPSSEFPLGKVTT